MEFELQRGFFQLKDSPCEGSANRITNTQGTKKSIIRFHYGRWHTEMLCDHLIFNPLPVELENKNSAWSAKTEVCTGQSTISHMPSQCGGFSFLQNKTTEFLSGEWGVFVWSDVSILVKITAMAKANSQNISEPNPRDQNGGIHRIPWGLGDSASVESEWCHPMDPASEHNCYKKGRQDNLNN